jgi:hypothetical protein
MGLGVVVRDHLCAFKFACSEGIDVITFPELVEVTTVRRALVLARDQGFKHIVLASYHLTLIQKISAPAKDRSMHGGLCGR